MPRRRRTAAQVAGSREAMAIAATLGSVMRATRRARRWTLAMLAKRTGLSVPWLSEIERGLGKRASLETWAAIGMALERPLSVAFSRGHTVAPAPRDAGHLDIQEHVLRLARGAGRTGTFELPTRSIDPSRSTDVGLHDPRQRLRILAECWNVFGDLGAAVRATHRKQAEAAATWPDDRVTTVWIVVISAANRALFARYSHVIDAAFPGSSRSWVRALVDGAPPPPEAGVVWFDRGSGHLLERRAARPASR